MITLLVICLESLFSENCLNRIGKSGEIVRTRNGNELKQEVETLSAKLRELTDEELSQVCGGSRIGGCAMVDGNSAFAWC